MLLLALLCTTGAGCSMFKKNTNGNGPTAGGPTPPKFPGMGKDPLMPTPPATPPPNFPTGAAGNKNNAILAGTVIDAYHRPIGNAFVRWVSLDEKNPGAPIDVAADAHGHFIIQGVQPGSSYKLIARTKQGDKMLAGTVLTSAPDVRVVIPIREDLVNADTPPIPAAPGQPAQEKPAPAEAPAKDSPTTGSNQTPTISVPSAPNNTQVGNPTPAPAPQGFVPGIAETPRKGLPMLTIPGMRPDATPAPKLPKNDSKLDTGPVRVPSCALLGNHLENLALKDSKGQTWEYKKHGAGRLMLLDFWGTQCVYCRDSMPTLNRLHQQYGSSGLEVIGIAIEAGKDERREAEAVNKMCSSMLVTYRQLMGRSGSFDVSDGSNFKIKGLPTLMLISEQGDVIWHHVGRPDSSVLGELERTIQRRLGNRTF
jgi:thiol-disulfide isomerase/thioredoxin